MHTLLWLVWMAGTMVWPLYTVATILLLIVAMRRRRLPAARPLPVLPLVGVLVAPTALKLWATLTFGVEHGARQGQFLWASSVLTGLALAVVVAAGLVLWRWRSQWWIVAPCALASTAATAMNWFVGVMAIANDWI